MAISVGSPFNYDLSTTAGAHAFLIALDSRLIAVGLTRATTGSDYNVAGADTQIPTTALGVSDWLAYDFTDTANATYPITVWFRIVYGYTSSSYSTSLRYVVQYRVSEGQTSGTANGADLQCYDGINTPASMTTQSTTYSGSIGDFVRYDGNSLTVLMGAAQVTVGYSGHTSSILELHIERRYSTSTGLVEAGFTGWVPYAAPAVRSPAQYVSGGISVVGSTNPSSRVTSYVSSASPSNVFYTDAYTRPTAAELQTSGGAAIAAPVFFMDATHRPTPAMKLFTVPLASFTQGVVYTMDFTGTAKPYLVYRPYSSNIKASSFAYAIEWEV